MTTTACVKSAYSGKCGFVIADRERIARVTKWTYGESASGVRFAYSGGYASATSYIPSTVEGSGAVEYVYDDEFPQTHELRVGRLVDLFLYTRPLNDGVFDGFYISCGVINESSFECDIDAGEVVGGSFDFTTTSITELPQFVL